MLGSASTRGAFVAPEKVMTLSAMRRREGRQLEALNAESVIASSGTEVRLIPAMNEALRDARHGDMHGPPERTERRDGSVQGVQNHRPATSDNAPYVVFEASHSRVLGRFITRGSSYAPPQTTSLRFAKSAMLAAAVMVQPIDQTLVVSRPQRTTA